MLIDFLKTFAAGRRVPCIRRSRHFLNVSHHDHSCRLERLEERELLSAGGPTSYGKDDLGAAVIAPPEKEDVVLADAQPDAVAAAEASTIIVTDVLQLKNELNKRSNILPGTTILIAPGDYSISSGKWNVIDTHGTEAAPITIAGLDPNDPPVFSDSADWWVERSSYVVIKDLLIRDISNENGMRAWADLVPFDELSPTHHIVFENLTFRNIGTPWGSPDALKIGNVDYFTIRNSYFEGWAEQAIDIIASQYGVIEDNQFIGKDIGPDEWGNPWWGESTILTKSGTRHILIQRNLFQNATGRHIGVNLGGYSGLSTYRTPVGSTLADGTVVDYEGSDFEVAGNRFYTDIERPLSLTASNRTSVHHNTFFVDLDSPDKGLIEIVQSNVPGVQASRNGTFSNNLYVFQRLPNRRLVFQSYYTHGYPETFTFTRNAWYNPTRDPHGDIDDTFESIKLEIGVDDGIPYFDTEAESNEVYGVDPGLDMDPNSPTYLDASAAFRSQYPDIGADAWASGVRILDGVRIVDNGTAGFDASDGWVRFPGPGFARDIHVAAPGTGSEVATWSFPVTPGRYRLAVTWQEFPQAATNSPFTVLEGSDPLRTVRLNQELPPDDFHDRGSGWKDLGTYRITGNSVTVQVSNDVDEWVIADAVRLQRVPVVARHIFYNNSSFDHENPAANSDDDAAIAPDKTALLPGQTATFENYSSYSRGINGIMVDFSDLDHAASLSADDFLFKVGNNNDPIGWPDAPAPQSIIVGAGAGSDGSDRVTIIWADNAIENEWLQVTILATANTGLDEEDVFYFGNAKGETGNSIADAIVDLADLLGARNNLRNFLNPAPIDFPYDFDRDGRTNVADLLIAQSGRTDSSNALKLITTPLGGPLPNPATRLPASDQQAYCQSEIRPCGNVFEQIVRPGSRGRRTTSAKLDWLYDLEPVRPPHRRGDHHHSVRRAVDELLAATWL